MAPNGNLFPGFFFTTTITNKTKKPPLHSPCLYHDYMCSLNKVINDDRTT